MPYKPIQTSCSFNIGIRPPYFRFELSRPPQLYKKFVIINKKVAMVNSVYTHQYSHCMNHLRRKRVLHQHNTLAWLYLLTCHHTQSLHGTQLLHCQVSGMNLHVQGQMNVSCTLHKVVGMPHQSLVRCGVCNTDIKVQSYHMLLPQIS